MCFKDGLTVNVHEFIPLLPVLRCSFLHYYLPGKNTENSPLTLIRGRERMSKRERKGEKERGKEKRMEEERKEGRKGEVF